MGIMRTVKHRLGSIAVVLGTLAGCAIGGQYGGVDRGEAAVIIVTNEVPGQVGYLMNQEGVATYRSLAAYSANQIASEFDNYLLRYGNNAPVRRLAEGRNVVLGGSYVLVVLCSGRFGSPTSVIATAAHARSITLTSGCTAVERSPI